MKSKVPVSYDQNGTRKVAGRRTSYGEPVTVPVISTSAIANSIQPFPSPEPLQLQRATATVNNRNGTPGAYAVQGIRPVFYRTRPRPPPPPPPPPQDQESHGLELPSLEHDNDNDIHSSLIHADPINEEAAVEQLPTAEPFSQKARKIWKQKLFLSLSMELLVGHIIIFAITIGFILQTNKGSSSTTAATTISEVGASKGNNDGSFPEGAMIKVLLRRLDPPEYTLAALQDPQSTQSRAYEWLTHDSEANLKEYPNWRLIQRFAMATVFYSTKGQHWVNHHGWLDHDIHECNWEQIDLNQENHTTCDDLGRLQILSVPKNKLVGTIPPELALLSASLEMLDVSFNLELKGTIPTEVGLLTRLAELRFAATELTGSLPTELGQLKMVDSLQLGSQRISGDVPSEMGILGKLTSLTILRLGDTVTANQQKASLPTELYNLVQLELLVIDECPGIESFSILPAICRSNMLQLKWLVLQHAVGEDQNLPSEISRLSNLHAIILVSWNLHGSIPSEVGVLTKLSALTLAENTLSGTLPSELLQLSGLSFLVLNNNRLSGVLEPRLFRTATKLKLLHLHHNPFFGTLATEVGLLAGLEELELQDTHLSGTLPTELLSLSKLTSLSVANTSLSGSIPDQLCSALHRYEMECHGSQHGCYPKKTATSVCQGTSLCGCSCAACKT